MKQETIMFDIELDYDKHNKITCNITKFLSGERGKLKTNYEIYTNTAPNNNTCFTPVYDETLHVSGYDITNSEMGNAIVEMFKGYFTI
jgi:hypothetical protein